MCQRRSDILTRTEAFSGGRGVGRNNSVPNHFESSLSPHRWRKPLHRSYYDESFQLLSFGLVPGTFHFHRPAPDTLAPLGGGLGAFFGMFTLMPFSPRLNYPYPPKKKISLSRVRILRGKPLEKFNENNLILKSFDKTRRISYLIRRNRQAPGVCRGQCADTFSRGRIRTTKNNPLLQKRI